MLWDQWLDLGRLLDVLDGHRSLAALADPHNEHIIIVPRLFSLADLAWFHGTNTSLVLGMCALQLIGCLLLIREVPRDGDWSGPVRTILRGTYVIFFLSGVHLVNLLWGFQIPFMLVFTGAIAAIVGLVHYKAAETRQVSRYAWGGCWVMAGLVATFSMANGILIWPTLILVAATHRPDRRDVLHVALVACLVGITWWSLGRPGGGILRAAMAAGPVPIFKFLVMYLGMPFRVTWGVAAAVGSVGLGAAAVVVWRLCLGGPLSRFRAVHLGVMAFALGTAIVTSCGRAYIASQVAIDRYATSALVFWVALLSVAIDLALASRRRWIVRGMIACVLCLSALLVPVHARAGRAAYASRVRHDQEALAAVVGVQDPDIFPTLYPLSEWQQSHRDMFSVPSKGIELTRVRGLGIFAYQWPHHLGRDLSDVTQRVESPSVEGEILLITVVEQATTGRDPGLRLHGRAWDTESNRPVALIYVVDETGRICGFGLPDPLHAGENQDGRADAWLGFARPTSGSALTAYGISGGKRPRAHRLSAGGEEIDGPEEP